MKNYMKLQNGSDIRGVAIDGIEGQNTNLTAVEAENIAIGFSKWLGKKPEDMVVAIGRDPRISGPDLLQGLIRGFSSCGVKVYDCGLASTPAMFMSTIFDGFKCDGGIMITASHLPFNRNGFKFFTEEGGLNKKDIKDILEYAAEADGAERTEVVAELKRADLMSAYCEYLRKLIVEGVDAGEKPLEGMKIVVDAGNGGGGFCIRSAGTAGCRCV